MPISATDSGAARAAANLREATRRLSHHASNAANSTAVNVEVLRSRLARGGAPAESLTSFSERAAAAAEQVAAAVTTMRALLNVFLEAMGEESGRIRSVRGDPDAVEVLGGPAVIFDAGAQRFAEAAGVSLSTSPRGIILKVLRRGAVDTDATA